MTDVSICWRALGAPVTQKKVAVDAVFYLNLWFDATAPISAADAHLGWDADVLALTDVTPYALPNVLADMRGAGTWDYGAFVPGAPVPAGMYRVVRLRFRAVGAGTTTIAPPGARGNDWLVAAPGGIRLVHEYTPVTVTVE
jgi:hypothetical protein